MADQTDVTIERVFALLDRWRHLPAYQLERRADIFFALFLPEVLQERFEVPINPKLIPEFPIKNRDGNQSSKVDFLALQDSRDGEPAERAFLVELKTDMGSRRGVQDNLMVDASERGLKELVLGVVAICRSTKEREKYVHLLKLLSEVLVDLVHYRDGLFHGVGQHRTYNAVLDQVQGQVESTDESEWPRLEVVYVQPSRETVIDFGEFADAIMGRGGIGGLFARYLKEWKVPAGSPDPAKT